MQHPTWNPTYDPAAQASAGDAVLLPGLPAQAPPGGEIAPWVAEQLRHHGWQQAQHLSHASAQPEPVPTAGRIELDEPSSWRIMKLVSTLGIVAVAVAIAAGGASGEPLLLVAWAVTVLLLVATTAVADRARVTEAVRHRAELAAAASAAAERASAEAAAARRFSIEVS